MLHFWSLHWRRPGTFAAFDAAAEDSDTAAEPPTSKGQERATGRATEALGSVKKYCKTGGNARKIEKWFGKMRGKWWKDSEPW